MPGKEGLLWQAHRREHRALRRELKRQAREYERRLSDLNHEAARIASRDAFFLPREVYENGQREVESRAETLAKRTEEIAAALPAYVTRDVFDSVTQARDARLKVVEDWKNKATGAAVILSLISGAIGAAIVKVLGG